MSIDNIPSNYNGLGYGDYTNPSQTYIDYSVNEINGPSDVQTFTITDGNAILPNGSSKYVVYIVKDNDITVDFSNGYEILVANGFDKTGQFMILTNSFDSTANISIKATVDGEEESVFLSPGDSRYLFLMPLADGTPNIYSVGANTNQVATIEGNNNLVYGNNVYLAGLTGATGAAGYNIAFGLNALASNTGGANVNAGSISNSIIIGANALSTNNGQFVLGSSTNPINTSVTGSGPPLGGGVATNFLQIILNGNLRYIPVYSALT